jgi:hypothetical protein
MSFKFLFSRFSLLLLAVLGLAGILGWSMLRRPESHTMQTPSAPSPRDPMIDMRLQQYGAAARERLYPFFEKAGMPYPPGRLILLGLKQEKRLEIWAAAGGDPAAPPRFIRDYPILAASGTDGPKRREGDRQVPEGFYRIESLNPNSRFHLSLRVNYPNAFDCDMAAAEGRTGGLGGDIMIHGGNASIGCLAMGDEAAEDLFVLAADTGLDRIDVLLVPRDLRSQPPPPPSPVGPAWLPDLYDRLRSTMTVFSR